MLEVKVMSRLFISYIADSRARSLSGQLDLDGRFGQYTLALDLSPLDSYLCLVFSYISDSLSHGNRAAAASTAKRIAFPEPCRLFPFFCSLLFLLMIDGSLVIYNWVATITSTLYPVLCTRLMTSVHKIFRLPSRICKPRPT